MEPNEPRYSLHVAGPDNDQVLRFDATIGQTWMLVRDGTQWYWRDVDDEEEEGEVEDASSATD
jgi:hypothetical protein